MSANGCGAFLRGDFFATTEVISCPAESRGCSACRASNQKGMQKGDEPVVLLMGFIHARALALQKTGEKGGSLCTVLVMFVEPVQRRTNVSSIGGLVSDNECSAFLRRLIFHHYRGNLLHYQVTGCSACRARN